MKINQADWQIIAEQVTAWRAEALLRLRGDLDPTETAKLRGITRRFGTAERGRW